MHPIFQVAQKDIQALNDSQARELLARLCRAELLAKGLGTAYVTWGGDQRAKDGGVDVRVDIAPAVGIAGYIPQDATAYQVKAESFNAAKIPDEMAPKGVLRSAISDFASLSGAYIIVSTKDNLSDSSLKARKEAMAKCLECHGLDGKVHLDFYDSRKIADWTESFPALVVWLRNELGKPLQGWKPYAPWAYYETDVEAEYLVDNEVKVVAPDSEGGMDTTTAIYRLRNELNKAGTSVRIVGLSGVGKTRLVQALFDDRLLTPGDVKLNLQNVLYTDLSNNPTPQPIAMLESLQLLSSDCVVVIDNCGQDVHQQLTEIVKRPDCKLRLVTVEYDIRDDLPEGTSCYRLEGASDEIVSKLLKRRYTTLSDIDTKKIVEFSGGNARVAFALASTSEHKGELAQLADDELFRRLFLQKNSTNDELQRCAEYGSLLYSFDGEDTAEKSELAVLASLAEVSVTTFFRNIAELQRRGLVQSRGQWRAVLPHAISNRLALKAIETNPATFLIQKFVNSTSERIARSFSRRLGYLHESKHARSIADEWLRPGGFLGDLQNATELQRQMLENIAPLNQRAALNAIQRAASTGSFVATSNRDRARYSKLLRSLAYEPDLFPDAARTLLCFALAEPENYRSDSGRDTLKSLFFLYLSGTLALPPARAAFVQSLATSRNEKEQELALTLLRAGLEAHHFTSFHRFDFGALKRGYGWHPRTHKDTQDWYQVFIAIAVEIGSSKTPFGAAARSLLAGSFRGIWTKVGMHAQLSEATRKLALIDGWPEGWHGIQSTLHWDKSKLDADSLAALHALAKELAPKDLKAKIYAKVLTRGNFTTDTANDGTPVTGVESYRKVQEEVQELGQAIANDPSILADLRPYIFGNEINEKVHVFGLGLGQKTTSQVEILAELKRHISEASPERANTNFIRGLIAGWSIVEQKGLNAFLDKAVNDAVWGPIFPELQLSIELNEQGYFRLVRSLAHGKAPSWQYRSLGYGRATDPLTIEQIGQLLSAIATRHDHGLHVAFDVLHMVIHCCDTKDNDYKVELRAFCMKFLVQTKWENLDFNNENLMHEVGVVVEFSLTEAFSDTAAFNVLTSIVQLERGNTQAVPRRLGNMLVPFFKACPMKALDACYFLDEDGSSDTALSILSTDFDIHRDSAVGTVPTSVLIDWCNRSPSDRFIFAARLCKLFEWSSDDGYDVAGVTTTAIEILKCSPDKKEVLSIYIDRFRPWVWSGSLSVILSHRLQLLDKFRLFDDATLNLLIEEAKSLFSRVLVDERKREESEERSRTGSFE